MRLDTAFRLSFYITLGLACACLAQAEAFFLPWFPFVCLPIVSMVFVFAWRHEGRWIIHETASNYLGIFIGLVTVGWIVVQMPRSEADYLMARVPWPAGLLPHLGLLLLMLLSVKLFRPKLLSDFWIIQTIGMMIVTLACVLAGDLLFAALMLLYLAGLVWCLALFQLYRGQRPAGVGPLFSGGAATHEPALLPWRGLGITRALRWSLVVVAVGLPLFMLMPRNSNQQWVPQKLASAAAAPIMVGVDSGINLNQVGTVELSPDPAFYVTVTGSDGKPAPLGADSLWRVEVLDYYRRGHWMTLGQAQDFDGPDAQMARQLAAPAIKATVPPPADGQRFLRFQVQPTKAGGLVLAEPVDIRYAGLEPVVGRSAPGIAMFQPVPGDAVRGQIVSSRSKATYRYTQVLSGADVVERMPARYYEDAYGAYIIEQPVPEPVAVWARSQLAALPSLTPAQRDLDREGRVAPEHHAAVSAAFCTYFAHSGAFRYSLTLRRHTQRLDPTADFLLNVKTGHCERFAGALALSLRSLGVPARVVKGYRGAAQEQTGNYVVRLDQAHSWVQVPVRDGAGWVWLTLDPTPGTDDVTSPLASWVGWFSDIDLEYLWRRYVLNYNADVQMNALAHLWQSAAARHLLWQIPLAGAAAALAFFAWRRRGWLRYARRGRPIMASAPGFYQRLLRVLARRFDLRPALGQTPLEFAACAGAALSRHAAASAWASLPLQAAHALYRARFGYGLGADEETVLAAQVAALQRAATEKTPKRR